MKKEVCDITYFMILKPKMYLTPNGALLFKSEVKFYLRVSVIDKVGILSDLTGIFKTFKISIETIYQDLQKGNQVANLIIFTHNVKRTQMEKAVLKINKLKGTVGNALAFCIYN